MNRSFDEVFPTLTSYGWLAREEAQLLWKYAEQVRGTILEVGTYRGRSASLLAEVADRLICVDPFSGFSTEDPSGEEAYNYFISYMSGRGFSVGDGLTGIDPQWNLSKVWLFRQRIEEWAARPVTMAYLDGDHSYEGTLKQVKVALACRPLVVAAHDINNSGGGVHVAQACTELMGNWTEKDGSLAVWDRR